MAEHLRQQATDGRTRTSGVSTPRVHYRYLHVPGNRHDDWACCCMGWRTSSRALTPGGNVLPVNGRRRREDERKTIGRKKTLGDLPCTDATLGVAKNVPAPSALPRGPGGGQGSRPRGASVESPATDPAVFPDRGMETGWHIHWHRIPVFQ